MSIRSVFVAVILLLLGIAGAEKPSDQIYRDRALRQEGDPARGKTIFHDDRSACSQCHTVDGSGTNAGPDLSVAGNKFSRADLIRSVIEPSSSIMMGYATTIVKTKAGAKIIGVIKTASEDEIVIAGVGDVRETIPIEDLASRETSKLSLMPPGLHTGLKVEEFIDLIAYLESLKLAESEMENTRGTPKVIPRLKESVTLYPFTSPSHGLHKPVWFEEHPVIDDVYIVAEQERATLSLIDKTGETEAKTLFVNIRPEVYVQPNEGLLGVAFHPNFIENRRYFMMHEIMDNGTERGMAIVERRASEDYRSDAAPELPSKRILRIHATTEVHHGGGIDFGPDDYLYIGMGDGGPQEDPLGHGQDLGTLEGKLLRIDVDNKDANLEYAIPDSNPFAESKDPNVRREIYAYGLRQAWRFSFDEANDELWIGDVGQNRFEEITIVRPGENHGWNVYEGFELFSTDYRREDETYVPPVVSFGRHHGLSITGGYVYRANPGSSFYGVYICGDYETKRLWGVTHDDRQLKTIKEIGTSPAKIVSFGKDREGSLYVVGYDDGVMYQMDFREADFHLE